MSKASDRMRELTDNLRQSNYEQLRDEQNARIAHHEAEHAAGKSRWWWEADDGRPVARAYRQEFGDIQSDFEKSHGDAVKSNDQTNDGTGLLGWLFNKLFG